MSVEDNNENIEKETQKSWWKNVGLKPNLRAFVVSNRKK
jgi:hypothetical protein